MNQDELLRQAQEVVDAHPGLILKEQDQCILLVGQYVFDCVFEDVPFYDEFSLEIRISGEYPLSIPEVRETTGRIKDSGYGHVFKEDYLCLGATCDLIDCIQSSSSLLVFLDLVIPSYLFGFMYYEEYGVEPPFGERSHGYKGLKEAYMDRYGILEDNQLYNLLFILGGIVPYRGHMLCPCGSGKRLRNCHGPALLRDLTSDYSFFYKLNAAEIIHCAHEEMVEQREAKRRLQAAIRSGRTI